MAEQRQDTSRKIERAHRILDAATKLMLRWGYQKTTLDDISREAGVAKATMYLHWKTRDELFIALIYREKLAMGEDMLQNMQADPECATLRGILRHSMQALLKRPLLKAALIQDTEVLGKLAQGEHNKAAYTERLMGFKFYLEFLREHKLVRSDLTLEAQLYMFSAIFMGFLLIEPFMPNQFKITDAAMIDLMAETAHKALEPAESVTTTQLQQAADTFMQYLHYSMDMARKQFEQELIA